MSLRSFAILSFGSLVAIVSPLATVPTFLALTETDDPGTRARIARRGCAVACGLLVAFVLVGTEILRGFQITLPAFRIGGGLVVLRVGLQMLQGTRRRLSAEEQREGIDKDDVSVTPLAVPILCGPATITTGVLLSGQAAGMLQSGVLVLDAVLVYGLTYALLRLAVRYTARLSEIVLRIASRVMGLLLVAIAAQFIVDGLREALPGLA